MKIPIEKYGPKRKKAHSTDVSVADPHLIAKPGSKNRSFLSVKANALINKLGLNYPCAGM